MRSNLLTKGGCIPTFSHNPQSELYFYPAPMGLHAAIIDVLAINIYHLYFIIIIK